tara:strand:- start:1109 stop:1786 length:678 start_codon:yes stop_codon:yes gene_type:complete
MDDYIKNKALEAQEKYLFNVPIIILDSFINKINLDFVTKKIESLLPKTLFRNIEAIYIGNFDVLNSRGVNAAYTDGVIYLTNVQDDEADIIDDIVHEIAHAVEEMYGMHIYSDDRIESEFIGKRKRLFDMLKAAGHTGASLSSFLNPEYSREFDEFLYQEVGYPALVNYCSGLFLSPYAITSIREYFARGFEHYFLKNDKKYLIKLCPQLYYKIDQMFDSINSGE